MKREIVLSRMSDEVVVFVREVVSLVKQVKFSWTAVIEQERSPRLWMLRKE